MPAQGPSSSTSPNALDAVANLASAISRADDLSHIYDAALDGLRHGLGVERASILLFDADDVIRFKAWRGLSDAYRSVVEGHSPWRPDSSDARVLCTPDVTVDPGLAPYLPLILAEGIRAMAFVPLVIGRRVLGKLMCYYEASHELTRDESVLAQAIADQVAYAVERTRTARDRDALVARTSLLAEVSGILSRSLDYEQTLQSLAEFAVPALADVCIVDIRREDGRIEAAGLACADAALLEEFRAQRRQYPIQPDEPYGPAVVMRTGEPLLAREIRPEALDVVPNATLRERFRRLGLRSAVVVPIRDAGVVTGTISLLAVAPSERRYSADDVVTALEVAQRAGSAIENARLYRAAQDANRTKDDFLATLSHELRTPLNAILGWARMIERGVLPPDRVAHGVASIRRNAEAQSRLIGDILDIARIRSGKLRLEVQRLDLHSIVSAAAETLEAEAEVKRVTLEVAAERGLLVEGDPARLQQLLWNLVSNAVKFTPEHGRVRIEARRRGGRAVIVVRDTGVGIDAAFLPLVFDRFRQGDASTTRYHSGLGLGLAITKHIAEQHGGRVWAESDGPGHGAAFTVELPLYAPDALGAAGLLASGADASDRSLADRRVLVVDDDEDSRQLVAMILASAGAVVDVAASAAAAYDLAVARGYELIVADIAMPGEDGFSLLRRLRARLVGGVAMPAIAVTAHAREEDRAQALSVGFVAHLAKPFEPERLLEVAATVLGAASRQR
jgi:signal transduction histidine kinase/ActR/RegA family two-component response regulator